MFCSKCGKEIHDEAVICPGCGCPTGQKTTMRVVPKLVPPSARTALLGLGMGFLWGFLMFLFMGALSTGLNGMTFFIWMVGGLIFGLLMIVVLNSNQKKLETAIIPIRKSLQADQICCEGNSRLKGEKNPGYFFLTNKVLYYCEYQKATASVRLSLNLNALTNISINGSKIFIYISNNEYCFLVPSGMSEKWTEFILSTKK